MTSLAISTNEESYGCILYGFVQLIAAWCFILVAILHFVFSVAMLTLVDHVHGMNRVSSVLATMDKNEDFENEGDEPSVSDTSKDEPAPVSSVTFSMMDSPDTTDGIDPLLGDKGLYDSLDQPKDTNPVTNASPMCNNSISNRCGISLPVGVSEKHPKQSRWFRKRHNKVAPSDEDTVCTSNKTRLNSRRRHTRRIWSKRTAASATVQQQNQDPEQARPRKSLWFRSKNRRYSKLGAGDPTRLDRIPRDAETTDVDDVDDDDSETMAVVGLSSF